MNLVFLLKNELVLLNQRPKVSFVLCLLVVVDMWWGPWEQECQPEAAAESHSQGGLRLRQGAWLGPLWTWSPMGVSEGPGGPGKLKVVAHQSY